MAACSIQQSCAALRLQSVHLQILPCLLAWRAWAGFPLRLCITSDSMSHSIMLTQAHMDKNVGGCVFAPAELRSLAPAERAVADPAVFARVEGLGRIPFTNLRRPKPLMDTGSSRNSPTEVRGLGTK